VVVLVCKVGEAVRIDHDVEVIVLRVRNNQVRLGIKAPRDVTVDREEVAQRKCEQRVSDGAYYGPSNGFAPNVAAVSDAPNIRIIRRRLSNEAVPSAVVPVVLTPILTREGRTTLHITSACKAI